MWAAYQRIFTHTKCVECFFFMLFSNTQKSNCTLELISWKASRQYMTIAVGGMLVVRIIQLKCVNYNTYNKISYLIQIFFGCWDFGLWYNMSPNPLLPPTNYKIPFYKVAMCNRQMTPNVSFFIHVYSSQNTAKSHTQH